MWNENKNISQYRLIIFDADGTLRRCTVPGQPCPNNNDEWEIIPGVKEKLATIDWGYGASETIFAIASNQAGVSLGYLSYLKAFGMLERLACEVLPSGKVRLTQILMCHHAPDDDCACRKPKPGMLIYHMMQFKALPSETLFVGDMQSDVNASAAAECDFASAQEFFRGYWDD